MRLAIWIILCAVPSPAAALDFLLADRQAETLRCLARAEAACPDRTGGRIHVVTDFRYGPGPATAPDPRYRGTVVTERALNGAAVTSVEYGPFYGDPTAARSPRTLFNFANGVNGECIYAIAARPGRSPSVTAEELHCADRYVRAVRRLGDNIYFSHANGAAGDGEIWIYGVSVGAATRRLTVPIAEIGGFWAGDFTLHPDTGEIWLSNGDIDGAGIFRHDPRSGAFELRYRRAAGGVRGFDFRDARRILFTDGGRAIHETTLAPGGARVVDDAHVLADFPLDLGRMEGFDDVRVRLER
ncbi:MAG: hypothetical protein AAFR16_02360 [Pseudomonadota bacterium]